MSAPAANAQLKALILAGGKGTRLRPLTYAMAKQLVPVANKPILHYALDSLYRAGLRDFGIIISPETGDAIRESVKIWQPQGVQVTFILQDEPAGLAHAVKIAKPYLQNSDFIMYLGDNLINADLGEHIRLFQASGHDASILLKPVPSPSSFGVAELDAQGQVKSLVEKPKEPKSNLAMVGVYLFTPKIFEAIDQIQPSWRGELEITDAIQMLILQGAGLHAHIHEGWWLDTGKKDDLLAANTVVLQECLTSSIEGELDEHCRLQGTIHVGAGTSLQHVSIQGPVAIGKNCHLENVQLGPYTSIGDGCRLVNCRLENSVLLEDCVVEGVPGLIEHSLLGKGCQIKKAQPHQQSHKYLLADHSEIEVS